MSKGVKVFTLTSKDFKWEYFRAGGPGGQNQNKRNTGVRCKHEASGAVGESREHRTQLQNKREAFKRMGESAHFVFWANQLVAGMDIKKIEREVDQMLGEDNLRIEYGPF